MEGGHFGRGEFDVAAGCIVDRRSGSCADRKFLPSNPALLGNNMNAGQRINLRLRPPGDTSTFYEYDQLVLVMLHEVSLGVRSYGQADAQLTHIEHGPHDASFYKLLAVLEEEYYDLKRKGYSGESTSSPREHNPHNVLFSSSSELLDWSATVRTRLTRRRGLPWRGESSIRLQGARARWQSEGSRRRSEETRSAEEDWQGWNAWWERL